MTWLRYMWRNWYLPLGVAFVVGAIYVPVVSDDLLTKWVASVFFVACSLVTLIKGSSTYKKAKPKIEEWEKSR